MGAASCGAHQDTVTGAALREGQSSMIIYQGNYDAQRQKRKTNCFHKIQKKK